MEAEQYREIRRWVIQAGRVVTPKDLQSRFRLTWNEACGTLEDLERDRVLARTGGPGRLEWSAAVTGRAAGDGALGLVEAFRACTDLPEALRRLTAAERERLAGALGALTGGMRTP